MNWLESVFVEHSGLQAVVVLSVIIAAGLGLGKIRVMGVSLGVTCVFFTGILAGHLGFSIDPAMLDYAQSFGLVLFVYELGLKVGPGFFSSFRSGGIKLNLLGMLLVILGTLTAMGLMPLMGIPVTDMVGILSGACTNTPALGAAQQTLQQLGITSAGAALSCAVTYPLGVVGVIIAFALVRRWVVKPSDIDPGDHTDADHTFIAAFEVENPGIYGMSVKEVAALTTHKFVISRLWRQGGVSIPTSDSVLRQGDRLLVVSTDRDTQALTALFGVQEAKDWNKDDIDWNAVDSQLISKHIVVSRPGINGKKLGSLRLRNSYGINISRVSRAGVQLLATPGLVLQLGDRLTVVGEAKSIENVEKVLGNTVVDLKDPNLAAVFIGLVLGLIIGAMPIMLPGMSAPIKLGLAGGPIIAGILIGRYGPQLHMVTYTTRSANLMLRGIGLSLFLACLGLSSGAGFMDTILQAHGLLWILAGFIITVVPSLLVTVLAMRVWHLDFGSACGMVCGAMANPMALTYANENTPGDNPSVSYATVYPVTMFARVVVAQLLVLILV